MTTTRLFAIAFIWVTSTVAWFILGTSVTSRSGQFDGHLSAEVAKLWGGPQRQTAPSAFVVRPVDVTETVQEPQLDGRSVTRKITRTVSEEFALPLDSSRVSVDLGLQHRQKGLLWYDTYTVAFKATYMITNPDDVDRPIVARLQFPSNEAIYDEFSVRLNGVEAPRVSDLARGVEVRARIPAGGRVPLEVRYMSRGLDEWSYALAPSGVTQVRDLVVTMTTDFDAVDFPPGTMSPTTMTRTPRGRNIEWKFSSLVTGQAIGMDLPDRTNPGPLAARITFFAPVSLLFFMTVLVILGILSDETLHPMNYAFLSAAFFAFHLLLAYMVDHVNTHASFVASAATSIVLVVSYLRLVAGMRFAVRRAGVAQLVFLVFFSYAFFFEGYTGLTVTIGSIVTLFVLMQATARVDWSTVFRRPVRA
ncbi:MAG TPA: inner membrane CreD family protein [Vicinamibacterales bacterium]|jgi:inner membrane protein involved in colicin E2 resistance|nr:inner membrane CreD family protein [Vicinamibacterales bacterium]